ncbi:hypothetical protein [Marmoricola sp. RAF53]|uniref:hypothetical protein n=1 Tax=Marmoricola sp. RAF53 TaxID=3233059 RepID=UPI003F9E8A98
MRTDDFKISPTDGYRYAAPERDRDRHDREYGYLILGAVVVLVMVAVATGRIMIFSTY